MNYLKAVYGAIIAGLGALSTVLVGNSSFSDVTDAQWVTIALAALSALAVIWAVPNSKAAGAPTDTPLPAPSPAPVPPLPSEPQA